MSATKKIVGLLAGVAAVAAIGTAAIAQGNPPNPLIGNHPIAAGQQSSQHTAMGETGVPAEAFQVRTAVITQEPAPVAVVEQPAPVVAEAPAPAVETTTMGAAPAEPVVEAAPMQVARADRN